MRRETIWRPVLAAGVCGLWLAAAAGARAAAIPGGMPPEAAASGLLLPVQAPPGQNVESNLAMLHQRLGITPAQEQAFAGFAAVMRENARAAAGGAPPAGVDAVEQLRLAIQYGQRAIDGMRRLLPALETLYASLSPVQRNIANQLFRQGPRR